MNLNVMTEAHARTIAAATKETTTAASEIAQQGKTRKPGKASQITADDLYSRILKFIPAPLIGLYLLIVNAVLGILDGEDQHDERKWACWAVFIVFGVLIAAYLRNRDVKRASQILISVVAYVAWATASPGPFQLFSWWNEGISSIVLAGVIAIIITFKVGELPSDVIEDIKP